MLPEARIAAMVLRISRSRSVRLRQALDVAQGHASIARREHSPQVAGLDVAGDVALDVGRRCRAPRRARCGSRSARPARARGAGHAARAARQEHHAVARRGADRAGASRRPRAARARSAATSARRHGRRPRLESPSRGDLRDDRFHLRVDRARRVEVDVTPRWSARDTLPSRSASSRPSRRHVDRPPCRRSARLRGLGWWGPSPPAPAKTPPPPHTTACRIGNRRSTSMGPLDG